MNVISNTSAAAIFCFVIAVATFPARAETAIEGGSPVASATADVLAFNPQPDPPGRPIDEDGFGRS